MKEFIGFKKGVNLGGWFSQCDYSVNTMTNFITEADIKKILTWGVDHVRIPVDYNVLENEDGSISNEGFNYYDKGVSLCLKHGLNVVIDLHKTRGFSFDFGEKESGFFDSKDLQENFYTLWEEIARRYGTLKDRVAFELLNEITDKELIGKWNEISYECIKRIRKIAPETVLLVGSYWNNSVSAVKDLAAPYDDRVVYNFHCYEPMLFTHQGATWTPAIQPEKRMRYDESESSIGYFTEMFANAVEAAKSNNTVLYCGEYGVIDCVTPEDTLKWYKTINSVFNIFGISRCAWNYKKMDFGLSEKHLEKVINELVKYL